MQTQPCCAVALVEPVTQVNKPRRILLSTYKSAHSVPIADGAAAVRQAEILLPVLLLPALLLPGTFGKTQFITVNG